MRVSGREICPVPYELIPLICAAILSIPFAVLARRLGCCARDAAGASLMFFAGLTIAGSMALHNSEILYNQILGINPGMYTRALTAPQVTLGSFTYDFRFYSLQLFGGMLLYLGATLAMAAVHHVQGAPSALRIARRRVIQVVLLVAPLIPMHVFAVATIIMMALAWGGLLLVKRPRQDTIVERRRLHPPGFAIFGRLSDQPWIRFPALMGTFLRPVPPSRRGITR
jgi:hypothetical protein